MNLYESITKEAIQELPVWNVNKNKEDIYLDDISGDFLELSDVKIETYDLTAKNMSRHEYHIAGYYKPKSDIDIEGLSYDGGEAYFDYNVNSKEFEQFTPEEIFYYSEDNEDAIYDIEKDMDKLIDKLVHENFSI